jgi:hypothetical protein
MGTCLMGVCTQIAGSVHGPASAVISLSFGSGFAVFRRAAAMRDRPG